MSEASLRALAEACGILTRWRDVHDQMHDVAPDTLRRVLTATGIAAASDAEVTASAERLRADEGTLPPLLTALQDTPFDVPGAYTVTLEDGRSISGSDRAQLSEIGYHTLTCAGRTVTLAVAPRRCPGLPSGRPWGIAVQLYSLRRDGDGGIGDFGALRDFVTVAAAQGADAVAISPVHAQFSSDLGRFSPYAPSSRIMLNVLHAQAPGDAALEALDLVDWPTAARHRLVRLRAEFSLVTDRTALDSYRLKMGDALERHARFEALHAHFYGADPAQWSWHDWPEQYRQPGDPAVGAFAAAHSEDVAFHAWLQFRADQGLAEAQTAARAAGMRIGLISDLAVGTDGGGSHAWSRQDETMIGLSIGAPPDLLNEQGQNWGIAAFSPVGLRRNGYTAFIEMLRAALRNAGGVRIDHVMGLQRLWVVPAGLGAQDGAYLTFPIDDMLRLVALEAHRHDAVVFGEDLGTVPDGFQERLIGAGLFGMRVLWFERDGDRFRPPHEWSAQAVGMTSTHDLATVAGWWSGRDLEWRERMGWVPDPDAERRQRAHDRDLLWDAFRQSGAAEGDAPPPGQPNLATDAALRHVARAACEFVLLPLEDVLARVEQPNLPATLDEHPNWRRRMPGPASALLDTPEVKARLSGFRDARGRT